MVHINDYQIYISTILIKVFVTNAKSQKYQLCETRIREKKKKIKKKQKKKKKKKKKKNKKKTKKKKNK